MKLFITITFLLFGITCFTQDSRLLKLIFTDKSNFDITTRFQDKMPTVFYVLNKTDKWNTYRFHMDEDLSSESVRRKLENDEHSPYNHSYLFADTLLSMLFTDTVKQHLYQGANSMKPRLLVDTFKVFKLINSFKTAKNGFFFSVTDPIFTKDKQYAFIDITTYKKDKETEDLNFAYFGTTLLIYKNQKGKGWTRIKKRDYLIL